MLIQNHVTFSNGQVNKHPGSGLSTKTGKYEKANLARHITLC